MQRNRTGLHYACLNPCNIRYDRCVGTYVGQRTYHNQTHVLSVYVHTPRHGHSGSRTRFTIMGGGLYDTATLHAPVPTRTHAQIKHEVVGG